MLADSNIHDLDDAIDERLPKRLGDLFVKAFGLANGVDLDLPPREPHEPARISLESPLTEGSFSSGPEREAQGSDSGS